MATTTSETRTVRIPGCDNHCGTHAVDVAVPWVCCTCGGPRGEPFESLSFDGSRRLGVHSWQNACGHIDFYFLVREQAGIVSCTGWPHG